MIDMKVTQEEPPDLLSLGYGQSPKVSAVEEDRLPRPVRLKEETRVVEGPPEGKQSNRTRIHTVVMVNEIHHQKTLAEWEQLSRSASGQFYLKEYDAAEDLCWEALSGVKKLGEFEPRLGVTLSSLAVIHRAQDRRQKIEDLSNLALRIFKANDDRSVLMAKGLLNAAVFYHDEGRWTEARRLYLKSLGLLEEGSRDDLLCHNLVLLARVVGQLGRGAQAQMLLKRVHGLEPQGSEVRLLCDLTAAELSLGLERFGRAEAALDNARSTFRESRLSQRPVWESSLAALSADLASSQSLAAAKLAGSRSREAIAKGAAAADYYRQAIALRTAALGDFHSACGDLYRRKAHLELESGQFREAESSLRYGLNLLLTRRGPYHYETLKCLQLSQQLLRRKGQWREADQLESRLSHVERKVNEKARETYVVWGEPES